MDIYMNDSMPDLFEAPSNFCSNPGPVLPPVCLLLGAEACMRLRPRLHHRLLTLCPAPTDPVCVCVFVSCAAHGTLQ